jgi:hypothetical protein
MYFPRRTNFATHDKILTGRETELDVNVMKELKSVTAEKLDAVTGYFYKITHVALMNPRCCSRAAALQSAPS